MPVAVEAPQCSCATHEELPLDRRIVPSGPGRHLKSASKTQRCDNASDNFWHAASGNAGDARGTVTLRRDDLNQPAGMSTGTSCTNTNTNFWHYKDIFVWM